MKAVYEEKLLEARRDAQQDPQYAANGDVCILVIILQMQDMTQVVPHNTPLFQLYLIGMNNVITITLIDSTPYPWGK